MRIWVNELIDLGYVELRVAPATARITNEGMALVEKDSPFYAPFRKKDKDISIKGPIIGSAIAINGRATVNISLEFLKQFEKAITESPDMNKTEKKKWIKWIKELSIHPALLKILEQALKVWSG